jgi:hypothetical protein
MKVEWGWRENWWKWSIAEDINEFHDGVEVDAEEDFKIFFTLIITKNDRFGIAPEINKRQKWLGL